MKRCVIVVDKDGKGVLRGSNFDYRYPAESPATISVIFSYIVGDIICGGEVASRFSLAKFDHPRAIFAVRSSSGMGRLSKASPVSSSTNRIFQQVSELGLNEDESGFYPRLMDIYSMDEIPSCDFTVLGGPRVMDIISFSHGYDEVVTICDLNAHTTDADVKFNASNIMIRSGLKLISETKTSDHIVRIYGK